ncbi:MAG: hypothetical protein ACRCZF_15325, partial [Gemmataceae bacterium]
MHTAEGRQPIETIRPGQQVWSYDRRQQSWELQTVLAAMRLTSDELATVTLDNGTEIVGTAGHPVWVCAGADLAYRPAGDHGQDEPAGPTPGRWVRLSGVRAGDILLARGGTARVAAVSVAAAVEVPVYNLSVGGLHSYAVGEVGVLAHNT